MFNLEELAIAAGYVGLFIIIYAETGLLIGFFLPGDSLLVTTGLLAERGHFSVFILIPLLVIAAIAGDATGYQIGKATGPRLFRREDSRWFKRAHLERAQEFYERHGGKTIVIARFLAIVRTFAPTIAGAADMGYARFALFNVVGATLWVSSMVLLGFAFGTALPNPDLLFIPAVGLVILASIAPGLWHLYRERRRGSASSD
ncbi:MAG: DedA family protein [Dehalococcoidia bacterium]